jgi:hypothetical protein
MSTSGSSVLSHFSDVHKALTDQLDIWNRFKEEPGWVGRSQSLFAKRCLSRHVFLAIDGVLMPCKMPMDVPDHAAYQWFRDSKSACSMNFGIAMDVPDHAAYQWFRGSKSARSMNFGIAVDGFGIIRLLYGGTPAHQHDLTQWQETALYRCLQAHELRGTASGSIPSHSIAIGDAAYGQGYPHVSDFRTYPGFHSTGVTSFQARAFSHILSSARQIVERTVGSLKTRWCVLQFPKWSPEHLTKCMECGTWLLNWRNTHFLDNCPDDETASCRKLRDATALWSSLSVVHRKRRALEGTGFGWHSMQARPTLTSSSSSMMSSSGCPAGSRTLGPP